MASSTGESLEATMRPRALLSVYDKTGIVEFAKGLDALGFEIASTGGTARKLREAGLDIIGVSDITGHPEILMAESNLYIQQSMGLYCADWKKKRMLKDL